jgi:NAD(P)H-quinone oxidoreductase subunit 5
MTTADTLVHTAVMAALVTPAALLAVIAVPSTLRRPLAESVVGSTTRAALFICFAATVLALVVHVTSGTGSRVVSYGAWFSSGDGGFHFDFLVDAWSLGFAALSTGICGIVAAFSHRYLHREPGYHRYFILFATFVLGMLLVALAGSIEVLFAGWELLGLSSALLVGFFHERRAPVVNAFRVLAVYRAGDAAMLSAAVLLHAWAGSGSLELLFSGDGRAAAALSTAQATAIAILLIGAVAAKSALLPFSGWLPRAMEGPTPSSAVYYGALSVHAGCFLLLRAAPLLDQSLVARALAALAGVTTALYASVTVRVQSDVKSDLAYASLTQVGLIVVEIALGLETLAFVHIIGHASYRLLQLLSAPNILHDLHDLENAIGGRLTPVGTRRPARGHRRLYLLALERGFLDPLLDRFVAAPFTRLANVLDRLDRALCGDSEPATPRLDLPALSHESIDD